MEFLDSCPVCGGSEGRVWSAELAAFIADRVFARESFRCRLVECEQCGLRYSDLRFDENEVGRLYADYRGLDYFRLRHAYEPWYTKQVNEGLGTDPGEIKSRQGHLENLLRAGELWDGIHSVLDFGGDRGQFIPASLAAEKWVYDISGAHPILGVQASIHSKTQPGAPLTL